MKERTVTKVWELTKRREAYRLEYAQLWNKTATRETELGMPCEMVDVILCPAGPGAAPPLETAKYWAYTAQWNLLDYPSIAFPVTKVKPEIDLKEEGYKPMNEQDEFNYQLCKRLLCDLRVIVNRVSFHGSIAVLTNTLLK